MAKHKKQPLGPLQAEWIRCLRSKEWKQGRNFLCAETESGVSYCCLGVACEVAAANGVEVKQERRDGGIWDFDSRDGALPSSVRLAMKFRGACGGLTHPMNDRFMFLDAANDAGVKFKVIADFVEAHPEAVFTEPA